MFFLNTVAKLISWVQSHMPTAITNFFSSCQVVKSCNRVIGIISCVNFLVKLQKPVRSHNITVKNKLPLPYRAKIKSLT